MRGTESHVGFFVFTKTFVMDKLSLRMFVCNGQISRSPLPELKERLLKSVAGINRGLTSREAEQKDIVALVEELEVIS